MAGLGINGTRGGLLLGLSWLVLIVGVGAVAGWIQLFGAPPRIQHVSLPIELKKARRLEIVLPPPPPPPPPVMLFETPPGGIVPAELTPQEKAAMGVGPPPPVTVTAKPPQQPDIVLPPPVAGLFVANPALLEKNPQGWLPKISDTGTTPLQAYGSILPPGNKPRIAIVISGLGISARATDAALKVLPAGVTLAFAPYAVDVQRWVSLARQKGHEVLLQVPMEPYDFPDSDPGQYTLRTSIGEEANTKRLVWSLTRFTGYVGVTNFTGGRFLSENGALEPMMTFLLRRGLMFFDNGAATRSVAPQVAEHLGVPFVQATNTIDSIQASMEIDHRLADLETEARAKGLAAGSGFLYPVTIERVAVWSRELSNRGFVLAPISAIVKK